MNEHIDRYLSRRRPTALRPQRSAATWSVIEQVSTPAQDQDGLGFSSLDGMRGKFQPGDHLHVRRRRGYYHHGIYVSDDCVIQFGSGVTLQNKATTSMNAVSLAVFEGGGTAEVVRHGYDSWFTGHHPSADDAWKVVARAKFLLKLQPRLPYNLVGHNCEIIANVCASGSWTESYQVRRWFGRKAAADAVLLLWLAGRSRAGRPLPRAAQAVIVAEVAVGVAAISTYNHQIGKFWREIHTGWKAHEQLLDGDPRNEASA